MPIQKNRKSMFGSQVGSLDLINKVMAESQQQADAIGDPKTVEDVQKLINIFNALSEKIKRIQK
jgi:hypothetical protein